MGGEEEEVGQRVVQVADGVLKERGEERKEEERKIIEWNQMKGESQAVKQSSRQAS